MRLVAVILWLGISLSSCPVVGQNQADEPAIPPQVLKAEEDRIRMISEATKSTVCVFGANGSGGGSGVVISPDGYALTNFHVVQGNGPYMQCSMPDGVLYDAVIVGIDPVGDVAMIKLLGRDNFPAAKIGDSSQLKQGDWCFAVGNPFLLATDFQPTVTWGLVSGIHRYQYPAGTLLEYADCIQTDAAINPGNSGGALFNTRGELIGINGRGSFEKRGRINVGVGYAISINQIKLFLHHLSGGRIVDHATLGATVTSNDRGEVRVSNILETSDAFIKGLRFDDEIIRFGGREIHTVNQFKNELGIYPKGYRVPIVFGRDGKQYEIVARLTGVHATEKLIELTQGSIAPEMPTPETPGPEGQPPSPPQPKPTDVQELKDQYEAKPGFANYYFNRKARDEVWTRFLEHAQPQSPQPTWRLRGSDEAGRPFECILSPTESGLQYDGETYLLDVDQPLDDQLDLPWSHALLGLWLYQRMVRNGPEKFGETTYIGRIPTPGTHKTAATLSGIYDISETNFFFNPQTGQLEAMEVYSSIDDIPLEISFLSYREQDHYQFPDQISLRIGNMAPFGIQIEKVEFMEGPARE